MTNQALKKMANIWGRLLNLSEIGRGGCPILQAVNRSPLYACSWCDNTQLQAVPATNHRHIVYTSRMQPI